MRIDIEKVRALQNERRKINQASLEEMEFYDHGKRIKVDPKHIKDFLYTGLSNIDFITTEFYKRGFDDGWETKEEIS